ncbi:PrpF protein [Fusarium tricinctum]|uniref:PrpF protein n=1 Tax=Fusarium tricinctum TaxID=61284 RepID=A0A8K0S0K6_9HYPO|nr:PrpF protein [Fusarium tricinctum]
MHRPPHLQVLCRPQILQLKRTLLARPHSISTLSRQNRLPASYYRGGSSRAVFFNSKDLPSGRQRDDIFRGVIGSPDPHGRQLDGMGGGISSLSKVCIVGPSTYPEADVDYTFVSLGIKDDTVDYSSNCGNMSAAVGPYAVDSGLLPVPDGSQEQFTVRIHNTNTGKIINASFPIMGGEAVAAGDFTIDGVAGTAAPIRLDFMKPAGSRTRKLLPTGSVSDIFDGYQATCIDVGNPCVFVCASELKVSGELSSNEIEANVELKDTLDSIRRQAGIKMGLAQDLNSVPGSVPKIAIASPRENPANGEINIRAMSVGQAHKAIPVTVALSVAAAAKLPGSSIAKCLEKGDSQHGLDIYHASGRLRVDASFDDAGELTKATVFRTARRLMEGMVYWK